MLPCKIHTILTESGVPFAEQPRNRDSVTIVKMRFDLICEAHGLDHHLTKPNPP